MEISQETVNIISFLQEINANKLRKPNDLAIILDVSSLYNGFEELEILTFQGTSIHYLNSTIRKSSPQLEGSNNLYNELVNSIETFRFTLSKYLEYLTEENLQRFKDIYFENTQGALRNIIDLSHDFALLKQLQISLKESEKK